jgi:hypothetical protein
MGGGGGGREFFFQGTWIFLTRAFYKTQKLAFALRKTHRLIAPGLDEGGGGVRRADNTSQGLFSGFWAPREHPGSTRDIPRDTPETDPGTPRKRPGTRDPGTDAGQMDAEAKTAMG